MTLGMTVFTEIPQMRGLDIALHTETQGHTQTETQTGFYYGLPEH